MCQNNTSKRRHLDVLQDVVRAQICTTCERRLAMERRRGTPFGMIEPPGATVPAYACERDCETFRQLPRLSTALRCYDAMLRSPQQVLHETLKSAPLPVARRIALTETLARATEHRAPLTRKTR